MDLKDTDTCECVKADEKPYPVDIQMDEHGNHVLANYREDQGMKDFTLGNLGMN